MFIIIIDKFLTLTIVKLSYKNTEEYQFNKNT